MSSLSSLQSQRFTFTGSGGDPLAARLDLPPAPRRGVALFAHCFTCSQDVIAARRIAQGLVDNGVGVLRFDFTGLGSSAGDFANTTFSSNVDDVVLASLALADLDAGPLILVGHSLGGAAVLAAAPRIAQAVAVVTINAPADPAHLVHLFPDDLVAGNTDEVTAEIAGRSFRIRREMITDLQATDLGNTLATLHRPLLVLHAPQDSVVDISNARQIFEAARHPKSFVSLDGADHLLTGPGDGEYAASVIAAWTSRYLPPIDRDAAATGRVLAEGEVSVSSARPGGLQQTVSVGRHTFVADEPLGVGDDAGPNPYDLLLASLGACTAMTLRMYADRKGWPLDDVSVRLQHSRRHADDCEDCHSKTTMVEVIERDVDIVGDLTPDQRERLAEIAERCPVHRTLTGDIRVVTRFGD